MWKRYLPFQHRVTNPLYQLFRTIWGCFSTCFSFQVTKQVISLCLGVFSSLSGWVHVIVKMSKEVHKVFCGWIDKTQCYLQGVIWGAHQDTQPNSSELSRARDSANWVADLERTGFLTSLLALSLPISARKTVRRNSLSHIILAFLVMVQAGKLKCKII